jgi:hypothetical protein
MKLAEGHRDTAICIAELPCSSGRERREEAGVQPFLLLASVLPPGFGCTDALRNACPDECGVLTVFQIRLLRQPDGKLRPVPLLASPVRSPISLLLLFVCVCVCVCRCVCVCV